MPKDRPLKWLISKLPDKKDEYYIRRLLSGRDNMRMVFLSVAKNEPCIISDILDEIIMPRTTAYTNLNLMLRLGVVGRVAVKGIKSNHSYIEKRALDRFAKWTKTMPKKTRDYYFSKTGYYYITEYGEEFVPFACKVIGIKVKKLTK